MIRKLFGRNGFFVPALFLLLTACSSSTFAQKVQCQYHPWTGLGRELLAAMQGRPETITPAKVGNCLNPDFRNWQINASQNLPVMSAAIGLYRTPNAVMPRGQITYLDWWIKYLTTQIGQQSAPSSISNLRFFKGTELFSNIYDTADVGAVIAVRVWAYRNRSNSQIDQGKVNTLIDASLRYLRANWVLYGMAAGSGPAWTYDMGMRPDGSPGRTPIINPRPAPQPTPRNDVEYNPAAPRAPGGGYYFSGNFLALPGTRSIIGRWVFDDKMTMFARAIERRPLQNIVEDKDTDQKNLLQYLEANWHGEDGRNVYGLSSCTDCETDKLYALTQDQFNANDLNSFLSWLYEPSSDPNRPRVDIRLSTIYRIIGWNGFRASMMERNMNGTNFYGISYNAVTQTATFLFPWNDAGKKPGGLNGWCRLEAPPGQGADAIMRANNTKPTPLEVTMNLPPTLPRFHLVLSPDHMAQYNSQPPSEWNNLLPLKGTTQGSPPPVFTPADPEDIPWVAGSVPAGGVIIGSYDSWNWIDSDPFPAVRNYAHQSSLIAGVHQHYFYNATDTLTVNAGDLLYAWVYLDPINPPTEVMLQWNDGTWDHRAYWGADNLPSWGTYGTSSRQYMGALPPTGQWILLQVPASMLGLEGRTLNGMAFTLFDGRATWDEAGKTNQGGSATNLSIGKGATQSSTYVSTTPASQAVDGYTNGYGNYTHTNYDYHAWWQVDLGASYSIDQINLWNRLDCCPERLSNFYVLVSDDPFTSTDLTTTLNQPGVSGYYVANTAGSPSMVAILRSGRYVRVQLAGTNYLSLSEVQVMGRAVSAAPTPPAYEGFHDSVDCSYIQGWVWDANNPGARLNVSVYDEATQALIATGTADQFRQDLVNAGKGDGRYGFFIPTPVTYRDGLAHTFRVKVTGTEISLGGTPRTFTCTPPTVSVAWVRPAESSWGTAGTMTVAGYAQYGTGGVQLVWRDETLGTVWNTVDYQPAPAADNSWSNTIPSPYKCHTFRVYANYAGVRSQDFVYVGATAGYCTESASIMWIQPPSSAGYGNPGTLVVAGKARSAPSGTLVFMRYRDVTANTGWVQAPYAPLPATDDTWINEIKGPDANTPANPLHKYDVQITYDIKTAACTYQGTNSISWCP